MKRAPKLQLRDQDQLIHVNPVTLELFQRYKIDMNMRGLAVGTQQHYTNDLETWFIYVLTYQSNRSVIDLTEDDIADYLMFCKSAGNHSARQRLRLASISTFYKFLRKKRVVRENPVDFLDYPKHTDVVITQTYLSAEQVVLMREKLIESQDTQLRLYAFLSLSTMARVGAIARLRWSQIDFNSKSIRDVQEKEGKLVVLYFSDEVRLLLQKLLKEREAKHIDDHGWVFHTGRTSANKCIARGTLNSWCKRIGQMIGVPTLHPHDFRHSGATLLKNAGMSLEDVSTLLHHESTETTKKFYIKQDMSKICSLKAIYNI